MSEAARSRGQSGAALLEYLERRLDNAVYRAGLAISRQSARQLVSHGHFLLNSRRVDIPSQRLNPGDVVELRARSKSTDYFKRLDEISPSPPAVPGWLSVDRKKVAITVKALPTREDAEPDIKDQLIVEYYSR